MDVVQRLADKVLAGEKLTRQEAERLYQQPLEPLCRKANELRRHFCGDGFDLCSIVNAKSGRCSENCRFCAQSAWYPTRIAVYPLRDTEELVAEAKRQEAQGMLRYAIVTAGKKVTGEELDQICRAAERILQETNLSVCASVGLLGEAEYRQLKQAGVALYFGLGAWRIGEGDGGTNADSVSQWNTGRSLADQLEDLRAWGGQGYALYRYGSLFGSAWPELAAAECAALTAANQLGETAE